MNKIKYNGLNILTDFANCCDTCSNAEIDCGYSGRKSNGFCKVVNAVVNRTSICDKYERSETIIKKFVGGMKGQSKWIKEQIDFYKNTNRIINE